MKTQMLLIFPLLVSLFTSCSRETPQVAGSVVDSQGNPVPGAQVSIDGTQFQATTDAAGKYTIQFLPGRFTLSIQAAGSLRAQKSFDVTQPQQIPAAPIRLVPYPDTNLWEKYLREQIEMVKPAPNQSMKIGDFVQVTSVSIGKWNQLSEDQVDSVVSLGLRAKQSYSGSSLVTIYFSKFIGDQGRRLNESWTNSLRVRLQFAPPNTWNWVE